MYYFLLITALQYPSKFLSLFIKINVKPSKSVFFSVIFLYFADIIHQQLLQKYKRAKQNTPSQHNYKWFAIRKEDNPTYNITNKQATNKQ